MSDTPNIREECLKDTKLNDNMSSLKPHDDSNTQTQTNIQDKSKDTNKNGVISEPPKKRRKVNKKEIIGKPLTTKQLLEDVIQPEIAFLKDTQLKIIKLLDKIIRANLVKNISVNN